MGTRGPLPRPKLAARPAAPAAPMTAPPWLPADASAVWAALAPGLQENGRLTGATAELFAQYCAVVAELRSLTRVIAVEGPIVDGLHGRVISAATVAAGKSRSTLVALSRSLGLDTPGAARLDAARPAAEVENAVAKFVAERSRKKTGPEARAARRRTAELFARMARPGDIYPAGQPSARPA